MTTTIIPPAPRPAPRLKASREHLVRAAAALWRVVDGRGRVIGHIRMLEDPLGVRYRAERYHRVTGGFIDVGSFWSVDDAVAALR